MSQQGIQTVKTINSVNSNHDGYSTNPINNNNNANSSLNTSAIILHISCNSPPPHCTINVPPGQHVVDNYADPPPTYENVIDRNAPPPSYDSLFGRFREARRTSKNLVEFFINIVILLLSIFTCSAIICLTYAVPVYMVIIGGLYLYDCPQNEYIPIYVLFAGVLGICSESLRWYKRFSEQRGGLVEQSSRFTFINFFCLVWLIIGSVWVYKEYEPNYDPKLGLYCNKTLYLSAFWLITISHVLTAIVLASACCIPKATILLNF